MTRSDLHAASVSVAALPEADAAIVLREADVGDATSLASAIDALIRSDAGVGSVSEIEVPVGVLTAGHAPAWQAAVRGASGVEAGSGTLAVCLPALCEQAEHNARAATTRLEAARSERDALDAELRRLDAERDYELGKLGIDPGLAERVRRLRLISAGLFAVEAIGIYVAVAAALGLADGMPLHRVPATTWFQVLGLGTLVSVALFAATFLATRLIRQLAIVMRLLWVGAAVATVTTLGMALALGVVRWWGTQSAYEVSAFGVDVGSMALLVLVTLASVCLAVGSAVTGMMAADADSALAATTGIRHRHAETGVGVRARLEALAAEITRLHATIQLPLTLRTAFEQGVVRSDEQRERQETARSNRIQQALGVFRQVRALPPEIRPLVASEVFELRRRRDADDSVATPPRGLRLVGPAMLLLALGLSGPMALGGCSEAEADASDRILGCDATGVSPKDVCTTEFMQAAFFDWAQDAAYVPGATFAVIPSAGSFGETIASLRVAVPGTWGERGAQVRWLKEALVRLADIELVQETGSGGRQPNRSDLVSLIAVAAREAKSNSRPVELVVATDGWLVSLGVDTESARVPEPTDFLARLHAGDVPWDLSAFSAVTVCGLHNQGADAGKVGARDLLLGALFRAGNAPEARLRTSCRDLFPAIPLALWPAVDVENPFAAEVQAAALEDSQ